MPKLNDLTVLQHCLLELILNSLEAQATAIAIRIHLRNQKIQVVDNGFGIPKNVLRNVGENSAKREDPGVGTLKKKNIITEGSLVTIRGLSSRLIIMSRSQFTTETYGKYFRNSKDPKVQRIENRPSCGTTITVYASSVLCNWSEEFNCFAVKFMIIYLSLVNTQVSFSIRDDRRGSILLRIGKHQKQIQLLRVIFEKHVSSGQVQRIKMKILSNLKISGFWGVECTEFRRIQQVLLNLKPIHCPVLEKFMIQIITKIRYPFAKNANICLENIFFIVYIECLDSEYNLSVKDTKLTVDFHQIDKILDYVEKCLGKTETKECKPSNAFICKSIIPPISGRPLGPILGVKQKRSFSTKVSKHYFQRATANNQINGKVKYLTEIKIFTIEDSNVRNLNIVPPVSPSVSPEDSVVTKGQEYEDSQISRARQGCIEKPKYDKTEPLPTMSRTSRDTNVSLKNDEYEKSRVSKVNEKYVDGMSHDKCNTLSIMESKNQVASISLKERNCDNYVSNVSHKLIEKTQDISEHPIISQHWRLDYADEAVEVNCKRQKSVKQSQKDIGEALQKSESKIAEEMLPVVKEYQYDNHGVLWLSQKLNEKLSNRNEETYNIDCSQWSNWTYKADTINCIGEKPFEAARPILSKRFRFLPLNLHALLPFLNGKLINRDLTEDVRVPLNIKLNHRRQDLDVRSSTRRSLEFRLKIESLKSMKVLNQVNQEFIVALTKQDDRRLVVVVDQHAMHERIRYENLLRAYKRDQKNQQFIPVTLHRPIIISELSATTCNLLSSNQGLLTRYGLNVAFRNATTLLILAVPRCFLKKTFRVDNTEVEIAVKKLLQEVLDNLTTNGTKKLLPFTIRDAIASEACHGAIKFGDPLTVKQCESLVTCWKETDAPNRCAHGRPSVIPLLELSSHRRNYELVCQEKLNFASLRKFQRATGNTRAMTLRYHPYVTLAKIHESRFNCDDEALR